MSVANASTRPSRSGFAPLAVVASGAVSFLVNVHRRHLFHMDDAYITFRFAQHLAEGQGLVWNIGGDRTEGFSSLAHVWLLALGMRCGVAPETVAMAIGVLAALTTAGLMCAIVWRECGRLPPLAALAIALYLADEATARHTTSGLETQLFVVVLCGAYFHALRLVDAPAWRHMVAVAVLVSLAMICRPEGALYGAVMYGALAVGCGVLPPAHARSLRRLLARSGAAVAGLAVSYGVWKYRYFGYLLPNPYYVKSNQLALSGLTNVAIYLAHVAIWYGPLVGTAAYAAWRARRSLLPRTAPGRTKMLLAVAPAAVALAYYCTIIHEVGGSFRFSYPTYFFIVTGVAMVVATAGSGLGSRRLLPIAVIYALVLVGLQGSFRWQAVPPSQFQRHFFAIGRALRDTGLGPRATVVCDAAGIIPYVSRFNHVDPVGLTDNYLSGRYPLTLEQREHYVWSTHPDVYLGFEPPASPVAVRAADDPLMRTPYVTRALLGRQLTRVWSRVAVQDPELLHARMRELRDHWEWLGEIDWAGRRMWNLRSFVYVRRDSPHAETLRAALRRIMTLEPGQIDLNTL